MNEIKLKLDPVRIKLYTYIFFITIAVIGFGSLFLGFDAAMILQNIITVIFSMGTAVIVILQSDIRKDYLFDHAEHPARLMISYMVCLILMAVLNILSSDILPNECVSLFPYMSVAVLFTLLSNFEIGITLYAHFILISSLLLRLDFGLSFMNLFLFGIIGCCIVRSAVKTFHIWQFMGIMSVQYIVLYIAYHFLDKFDILKDGLWFAGSLVTNLTTLYLILYLADRKMIHKYVSKYQEIMNPEYPLLLELKEKAKSDYYNAVHTAYLSDRVARLLEADCLLAKAGGYYHKIGILRAKSHVAKSLDIGKENQFPEPLIQLIHEYTGRYETPKTVEAVIVMLSDAIVTSILYMYDKNPEQKLDYDKIIEAIFKKKYESGILQDSGISLKDLHKMKEYYKSEALYYDFLR